MPLPAPRVAAMDNSCSRCPAVCCRLTVVLMPEDRVPAHLTATTPEGLQVMAHEPDGWCAALDPLQMNCTIYAQRPESCRRFVMDGPYCRAARQEYHQQANADPVPVPPQPVR